MHKCPDNIGLELVISLVLIALNRTERMWHCGMLIWKLSALSDGSVDITRAISRDVGTAL